MLSNVIIHETRRTLDIITSLVPNSGYNKLKGSLQTDKMKVITRLCD